MADTAFQQIFFDEWMAAFERDKAHLRDTVTTKTLPMAKGARTATFLIADSGGEATTRGPNGMIPADSVNLVQQTATLTESHKLYQMTNFNIFAGQSDQRSIMHAMTRKPINRSIDNKIITELNSATLDANATASIMTEELAITALAILGGNDVDNDGMLTGLLTPNAWYTLSKAAQWGSSDYVNDQPWVEGVRQRRKWMGVTWIMHTGLPGIGTASADGFIYHKSAIGHAYNSEDVSVFADYHSEQDYSWARASIYDGAKLLQNTGVVRINLKDDIYVAS